MAAGSQDITQLLLAWSCGDTDAFQKLTALVYSELHCLAHHYMEGERAGHTLQSTALVNEVYLRLVESSRVQWQNRVHFYALSAQLMRRILVDFARSRNYAKRVVALRFLGGLTEDETAEVLKVSSDTVTRDWRLAKRELRRETTA